LNAATSSFANQVSYASGAAYTVAVGDFNGDGIPDLAVANNNGSASPGSVSVLLGNGDGTFKAPVAYAAGSEAMSLAVGDLNGDGILDLVVVNHNSGTVSVFLGNGDGTFQSQVTYATGSGPMSAAVGDFNGDGIPDLAVTNMWGNTVSVLLGNGDGTFRTQVAYATGIYPVSVAVGDFNGDGILDLAVTNSGSGTISVFLGNGDGSFQSQITYATGFGGESVAVGDFNGDGILDLAIANDNAGTISVLLGKGNGSFQSQVTYATGVTPMSVAVGDFNGDGIPDLAISNESSSTVSILLGKGDGTFQSQVSYATGAYPYSVAVGDFNGDGIPDLAVANAGAGTVSALMGSQVAAFSVNGVSVPGSGTHNIFASYSGDASRTVSQSPTVPLTAFSKTTPTVTVSCSPSVLTYGTQNSTCTASVGGGATGTVAFAWNGNAWSTPALSGGVATATGFAGMPVGTYTVSVVYSGDGNNNTASAATALTISPAPSVLMWSAGNQFESTASLSLAPVTAGNANGVTAQVFAANSPTGTLAFANGGTSYGTLPLQSVSTTNLVLQSNGMSSGWSVNAQVLTLNAGHAPDGTNTAASLVSNGGDNQFYSVVSTGNISGQTFTSSIWVKGVGSAIGKGGRIWVFPSDYSVTPGCDVPITANWARVSCTVPYGPGYTETQMLARYDLPRYGEAAGDTVLVWGPQFESSASVGPYVPTTTAAATMSQPVAVAGSYVTSPGVYTVTAAYSGDGSNAAVSGSVALTAVAATPLSVISVSPTTTPYGSPVSLSALISTGGDAPTGTVSFASDGGNVTSAGPTPATTENYIPFSRNLAMWSAEGTTAPPVVVPGVVLGPNGVTGDVATVSYVATPGGAWEGIRYVDPTTNLIGKTMTFSFWVRGDAPSTIAYYLVDWPYTANFAVRNTCNVTTVWQQCSITGTFPSNANGGFYLPIRSEGQASPITIYLWGPQLEQASTPGPYVSTAGTARTASGGVATGSVSTLAVGTHVMTAAVTADANVNATTSAPVNETVTDATPTLAVSCSPNPIAYGAGSTCTAAVGGGATGMIAWTINGSYAWGTSTINSGTTTNGGFTANVPGTYTIGVTYQGDADHNPASASTTLTITKAPLAVTLTTPSNPASYGTSVTFTAQVAAPATGTITFLDGATSIGSGTVSGGIATFTTTSLAAGTHNITASYSGDANYSAAVSALLPEAITKASATVNMTSSFSPSTYGQAVMFTFTATGVLGTPSGTVAISDGATLLATPTLNASGVATFITANLTVGSHNLTAVYGGDANYK
jgi:hypothetical protein